MRAPGFWQASPERVGLAARLLSPLGWITARATARRAARPAVLRPAVPVVCIGNLSAGGGGKTPLAMDVVMRLAALGLAPHVISRGYGSRARGAVRVDPVRHRAEDVGDEPLLLAAFAPVWSGRDRVASARAAVEAGAGCLVMDDGYQNPLLAKDISIVVANAERGFGNGYCLPAGPLREGVGAGLARADLLVTLGDARAQAGFLRRWGGALPSSLPHARGDVVPLPMGFDWAGTPVIAFAGIAYPGKFFSTLRALGADVVREVALADHQPFSPALLARLVRDAAACGAQLVTTEKDAVRLPVGMRAQVLTLPVRVEWHEDAALDRLLAGLVAGV